MSDELVGTLIFLVSAGLFFTMVFLIFYSGIRFLYEAIFGVELFLKPFTKKRWIPILAQEFPYYNKLPQKSKKRFLRKMLCFYQGKNFIPKKGLLLDERKKVLICAHAAQITFGLPILRLPHFKQILVYPSSYINKITKKKHIGEINTDGLIVLSWEHIQRGLYDPTDGYNVTLHELAHALRFEDFYPNEERNFFDVKYINRLRKLFAREKNLLKSGKHHFLNRYSGTNFEEFFACSIESYFERPIAMKKQMPKLYSTLSLLLNQDTAQLEELNKIKR